MAYANSIIYEIKKVIRQVKDKETEHYQIMKSFLNNTNAMLDILIK
jgi:predicted ATPase